MDPNGNIYKDEEENIPPADKSRLEAYLELRAERDEAKHQAFLKALKEIPEPEEPSEYLP